MTRGSIRHRRLSALQLTAARRASASRSSCKVVKSLLAIDDGSFLHLSGLLLGLLQHDGAQKMRIMSAQMVE